MLLNYLYLIVMLVMIFISMAFLSLLERKILGYIQIRKGANKVGFKGIIQPFSDAMKLFSKEFFLLSKINLFFYLFSPMFMLLISLMYWLLYPFYINFNFLNFGMIYLLVLLSIGVYPFIFMSWSSNSIYSMFSCLRVIAQSISFEVILFLMLFMVFMFIESLTLMNFMKYQYNLKLIIIFFPLYFMFLISMLIELNRSPFDLIEGESELVSGFNIEYYSSLFSMIFMAEYLSILFISMMICFIFINFGYSLMMLILMMIHIFFMVWIRGVMPRIRYDELMYLCWKKFLMIILIYLMFMYFMKMFILMNL